MRKETQRFYQARASVIGGVKQGGSPFVLASVLNGDMPVYSNKLQLACYKCKGCGFEFASASDIPDPFCVNCGSDEREATKATAQVLPSTDKELSFVECPDCETASITHDVTAKLFDGHMYCVTCGGKVNFEVQADGDGSTPVVMMDRTPEGQVDNGDAPPLGQASEEEVRAPIEGDKTGQRLPGALSNTGTGGATPPAAETADEKGTKVPNGEGADRPISDADATDVKNVVNKDLPAGPTVETSGEEGLEDPVIQQLSDEDLQGQGQQEGANAENFGGKKAPPFGKKDGEKDDDKEQDSCKSAVQITTLSTVLAFKGDKKLALTSVESGVLAFVNDTHIATLREENAGDNAPHIHKRVFAQAVHKAVGEKGIKAGLEAFGFELATVTVPQGSIIAAQVRKETTAAVATITEGNKDRDARFLQSMSIASAGLNKGFFKHESNPLKAGLFEALSAVGVQHPERLIDRVFAANGETYHKVLLQLASNLMEKPEDVRNAMAEAVMGANYSKAEVASEEDDQDDDGQDGSDEVGAASVERLAKASIVPITSKMPVPGKPVKASTLSIRDMADGQPLFSRIR